MTVLANAPWRPLTPQDPHWMWLARSVPECLTLPGSWEIRGNFSDVDFLGSLAEPDRSRVAQIFASPKPRNSRPVVLSVGDIEIKYIPPATAQSARGKWNLGRIWTVVLGLLVKFKLVLVFGGVVLTLLVYGFAFGWAFAVGLVVIIAIHESGHMVANRIKGIPASLPIFIPFLGAFIALKQLPKDAAEEAFIGVMGPLFGLGATLAALGLALGTGHFIFFAIAEMGFLLHVFNLMPVLPLDGGRTVGFWRWKAWIPGMVGVLLVLFYNPVYNQWSFDPFTIFIVLLIIFSMVREPKQHNSQYSAIHPRHRWTYTSIWLLALLVSLAGYWGVGTLHPFS